MGVFVKKIITILPFLLCVFVVLFCSKGFAKTPIEAKVKAAFVVNFARFINWPTDIFKDDNSPLVICTVGVEEDNQSFGGVESKKIKGHPVVLQSFHTLEESKSTSCQLLYIKGARKNSLHTYFKNSDATPVVTIGETEGFSRLGGTIEFVKIKDRLSFKINNSGAKQRRISINASLLDLAEEVH